MGDGKHEEFALIVASDQASDEFVDVFKAPNLVTSFVCLQVSHEPLDVASLAVPDRDFQAQVSEGNGHLRAHAACADNAYVLEGVLGRHLFRLVVVRIVGKEVAIGARGVDLL